MRNLHIREQNNKPNNNKPKNPVMGQTAIERLSPIIRPFTYTGLGFFLDPLWSLLDIKNSWGEVFKCMTVRVIHLVVSHSPIANSAIMALRRMISRRGTPKQIQTMGRTFEEHLWNSKEPLIN